MNRRQYLKSDDKVDINISPLIDMMFLLLIFFIVTTAFVEEIGLEIQKPKAASAQTLEKQSIMIGVATNGSIIYGGKEIGLRGVRSLVSRMLKEQDRPVIIMADESSKSGVVVDVIDECKLGGAKIVSIATEAR
ncbi:biopolymer transporter ExbD [bacterium]|nr:biopolymer transporter ExbD [bacterium]